MKANRTTASMVALLLSGAVISLGLRVHADRERQLDARQAAAAARARLHSEPIGSQRKLPADREISSVSEAGELAKRLRQIAAMRNPADQARAIFALMDTIPADQRGKFLDALLAAGIREQQRGFFLAVSMWAETDVMAAMAWAKSHGIAISTVRTVWLRTDPDAALEDYFAAGDRSDSSWTLGIARILEQLHSDLPHFRRAIEMSPPESLRLISEQARPNFSEIPVVELQEFIAGFPLETRQWVLAMAIRNLNGYAAKLQLANQFADILEPQMHYQMYSAWASEDAAAAIAEMESLGAGEIQKYAFWGVTLGISGENALPRALDLLHRYPEYHIDGMLGDLFHNHFTADPAILVNEISLIQGADYRNYFYRTVLGSWFRKDPEAARKWIDENPLPKQVLVELDGE